jgi:hypothetical protein
MQTTNAARRLCEAIWSSLLTAHAITIDSMCLGVIQAAAGDRVTLQLEGGASLRVRLTQPPPGTAAALAMVGLLVCMPV